MIPYVAAALILSAALALFATASNHKTLLDDETRVSMLHRVDVLRPSSAAAWGRMGVAQMLHHLAGALRMATGDLEIAPRSSILRKFPIKQLIVFVLPFPKSAPTAPALVAKGEFDFEKERADVRGLIESFASRKIEAWPDHPAFGPLTREQWGVMVWKHLDHHFRQFGV